MKKLNYKYVVVLSAFFLFFTSGPFSEAFASDPFEPNINHFFDGKPTVLKGVIGSDDAYFGGSSNDGFLSRLTGTNLQIMQGPLGHSSLILEVYGGGLSSSRIFPSFINGPTILTLINTDVAGFAVGGSLVAGHASVEGSSQLSAINVDPWFSFMPLSIYGGSRALNAMATQFVKGSIFMDLQNTSATNVVGLGDALGAGLGFLAVEQNMIINIARGRYSKVVVAAERANVNLGGDARIFVKDATIGELWGTIAGNIGGSLEIGLNQSRIGILNITSSGVINGPITIDSFSSDIGTANLGPVGPGAIVPTVTMTIDAPRGGFSFIPTIQDIICGPVGEGFFSSQVDVVLKNGTVANNLQLGSNRGITQRVSLTMRDGFVKKLILGSQSMNASVGTSHYVASATASISGGFIESIYIGKAIFTSLHFQKGSTSQIMNFFDGLDAVKQGPSISRLVLEEGSDTIWGWSGRTNDLTVRRAEIQLGSSLQAAAGSRLVLRIAGTTVIKEGARIVPHGLQAGDGPAFMFEVDPGGQLEMDGPFVADLSHSPALVGSPNCPLVWLGPGVHGKDKFMKSGQQTQGLVWMDTYFDKHSNTWRAKDIRHTQDYFGLSAIRKAANWLRNQQTWNSLSRAADLLGGGKPGLWANARGGFEKFYSRVGESSMPWVTLSIGLDAIQPFAEGEAKFLYGVSLGLGGGRNQWYTVNTTRNSLYMGTIEGYVGLSHSSGVYGTVLLQAACHRNVIRCDGFYGIRNAWEEIIPTQAVELGWKCAFNDAFALTPRAQLVFEELSKHRFKMNCGNEVVNLQGTFIMTTSLGLIAEYSPRSFSSLKFQLGVDWKRGCSGDFGAKSKVFSRTFKDEHNPSYYRTTVGMTKGLSDSWSMEASVFGDLGENKGVGGQLGATYAF